MSFKERLAEAIKDKGVTPYKIEQDIKISRALIGKYLKGTEPSVTNSLLISDYLEVSLTWLISGLGPKSKDGTIPIEPYIETSSGTKYYELSNGRFKMSVPMIPIGAEAKYANEHRDIEFIEKLELVDFIVASVDVHAKYYAFGVTGSSMDDDSKRSIPHGATVLAKEINKEDWFSEITRDIERNWIIVIDNTILCKRITDVDKVNGVITCHSLNQSPEYRDFSLKVDDIYQLFKIEARMLPN